MSVKRKPATQLPKDCEFVLGWLDADTETMDRATRRQIERGAKELERRARAYHRLISTLRELRKQGETRPVFAGDTVKDVRNAGKFVGAMDAARDLLRELGDSA